MVLYCSDKGTAAIQHCCSGIPRVGSQPRRKKDDQEFNLFRVTPEGTYAKATMRWSTYSERNNI